jgi:hypothetical protein
LREAEVADAMKGVTEGRIEKERAMMEKVRDEITK